MLMCLFQVPLTEEDCTPTKRRKNTPIITEQTYFMQDLDKLSKFKCPECGMKVLFKGVVYIGCNGCLNYFSELDIINANLEE